MSSGLIRLEVGAVAHGGHCVARHEGRVVFVRHALPGETVLARVTEAEPEARYWRADAVEVLQASPDRVPTRCPASGPGGCGGCDWQHAALPAQRRLKAAVVAEQFARLAGIDLEKRVPDFVVEPVPGDVDGLAWRSRVRFAAGSDGRLGLRRHRSHDVVALDSCPIAVPAAAGLLGATRWGVGQVEVVVAPEQRTLLILDDEAAAKPGTWDLPPVAMDASVLRRDRAGLHRVRGRSWVAERVRIGGESREFRVSGGGFWQVHPGAAQTLLDAVLAATEPRPGERALDLYSGVGLFAAGLAAAVGAGGEVVAVESEPRAVADARRNLHDLSTVRLVPGRVDRVVPGLVAEGGFDIVVLDPPRAGAGRAMDLVVSAGPRVVAYVACDPAALARDVARAEGAGYRLTALRGFDAFPMTHHVECLAVLEERG